MNEYLEKLNCKQSKINVKPLEEYARKNQIPIIEYESLMIIFSLIKAKKSFKDFRNWYCYWVFGNSNG